MISINELLLFSGSPITFYDVCIIYPPTLGDIRDVGSDLFNQFLSTMTISGRVNEAGKMISSFGLLYGLACQNTNDRKMITDSFSFFVREEVILLSDLECFLIGDISQRRCITEDNFEEFQDIILMIHHLKDITSTRGVDSKRAQEIKEKIARGQKKVAEIKRNRGQDDSIDLVTMVSSYMAKNSLSSFKEIWDFPYYAFYEQFIRMQYIEEYETNLHSALAGAKIPKSKMRHWIRKTNKLGGN